MIHTSRQLKDLVRNLAKSTGIEAHVLIRRYMMERLLERISLSSCKDSFILKGGLLVSALVGVDTRATMDIDATVKGLPVTASDMERILTEIIAIPIDDGVQFRIKDCGDIMEEMEYSGVRISMEALLDNSVTPLKLDISTGDAITPREIRYPYKLMFEDRSIPLMAYPLETVLAEKLETILSRSTLNSRMRDFYDVQVLLEAFSQEIDDSTLEKALTATAEKRGSIGRLHDAETVLRAIEDSPELWALWTGYQKKNTYARPYTWESIIRSVRQACEKAGLRLDNPSEN
ncbi:MAG: nucleotidyl transferase AbiEii/AbiGii toxin family protein [Oscillospiraceae bacterium]|nr:nucleotidyl transferase AbiEii/AbiGii toxin family protein [Oscillospiraceae bacterium]